MEPELIKKIFLIACILLIIIAVLVVKDPFLFDKKGRQFMISQINILNDTEIFNCQMDIRDLNDILGDLERMSIEEIREKYADEMLKLNINHSNKELIKFSCETLLKSRKNRLEWLKKFNES